MTYGAAHRPSASSSATMAGIRAIWSGTALMTLWRADRRQVLAAIDLIPYPLNCPGSPATELDRHRRIFVALSYAFGCRIDVSFRLLSDRHHCDRRILCIVAR